MLFSNGLIIFVLLLTSCSGFFLKSILKFEVPKINCWLPFVCVFLGIVISANLRSFNEAMTFFLAAIAQFTAYVFVSRLRQRGSFFWHVMAALASNGAWYATMHILKKSEAYWMLFFPYIIGLVAGRISGVVWAQYIEQKFDLKADATRDDRLAPGKRLGFLAKEWTFWSLIGGLLFYTVYSGFVFETAMFQSLLIVIGLGVLQNFFYAVNTRASARGNNSYIAFTGILSGITFYINAVYLFSHHMPWVLVVPYVLSTVLGSATGAVCSMIFEYITRSQPDAHLNSGAKKSSRKPYLVIVSLAVIWIFFQEPIFRFFGWTVADLKFPLSIVTIKMPRILVILTAALIFLLDTALHTLTSRAGNRNNTNYHVATLIPKGLMDFCKVSYIAQNDKIPDIVPIAVLSGSLGSLYGKDIAEKIERWLQARMDVEPEPARKPVPASSAS